MFRDAKQFIGLNDCQARSRQAFHFNAVMTALNLIKLQDRLHNSSNQRRAISTASWKTCYVNVHLLERFMVKF